MSKKKRYDDDDGRTIADMNVDGFDWYLNPEQEKKKKDFQSVNMTRREKTAMFWAAFLHYLPALFIILAAFGLAIFFVYLWLT